VRVNSYPSLPGTRARLKIYMVGVTTGTFLLVYTIVLFSALLEFVK
jgi:hypothetical protein